MRTNYVPKHFRDCAGSKYALHVGVDIKEADSIGNKKTSPLIYLHTHTHIHSIFILEQI